MTNKQTHSNFLTEIIENDISSGRYKQIATRFPPEPNGYLHLGHAKSICLNFGIASQYGGKINLRFDDTNPTAENHEFVENIKKDIRWLGFQWDQERYVSDYFDQLYDMAVSLVQKHLAYVDDSTSEQIASMKGTPTQPGTPSPCRERSIKENLTLLENMKAGKYAEGEKTLRAKIDMAHTNMLMRDPILYRVKRVPHHRTTNQWHIYPMYDFAHGQSDAIEKITHSLCTLEFAPHRQLYDWLIEKLNLYPSKQYEFARLNITYTVMSKRKLHKLIQEGHVKGWDDPRMPTLCGLRRRGYPPESIRQFCNKVGVAKRDNLIDVSLLEFCARDQLDKTALRRMAVLDPLKIVLTNYPETHTETLQAESNPNNPKAGQRTIPFARNLYIERSDFMEFPSQKYFRLSPGNVVRLKHAYIIRCDKIIKNQQGTISELHCTYIPESKSGSDTSGIRVKGVIHWVAAPSAIPIEVRLYDRLFNKPDMDTIMDDYLSYLNPESLKILTGAVAEPELAKASPDQRYQFLRTGYFFIDPDSTLEKLIFNRSATLRDMWTKKTK